MTDENKPTDVETGVTSTPPAADPFQEEVTKRNSLIGQPAKGPSQDATKSANGKNDELSVISKAYDINGDGVLDETEKALRDMDKSNRGFLTQEKMYNLMDEHLKQQKEMFKMKKVVAGLVVFTVILALCNLGTSFAAAFLAKDTTTANNALVDSKTGETVGVQAAHSEFVADGSGSDATTNNDGDEDRTLQGCEDLKGQSSGTTACTTASFLAFNSDTALRMIEACKAGRNVVVSRTFSGDRGHDKQICPSSNFIYTNCVSAVERIKGKTVTTWSCNDGATADITLTNGDNVQILRNADGTYRVLGDGVTSDANEPCDGDFDCDAKVPYCVGNAGEGVCSADGPQIFVPPSLATLPAAVTTTKAPLVGSTAPPFATDPTFVILPVLTTTSAVVTKPAALGAMGDACTTPDDCETGLSCSPINTCACNTSTNFGCSDPNPFCQEGFAGPFCTSCSTDDDCNTGEKTGYVCGSSCLIADGGNSCLLKSDLDQECVDFYGSGYVCNVGVTCEQEKGK